MQTSTPSTRRAGIALASCETPAAASSERLGESPWEPAKRVLSHYEDYTGPGPGAYRLPSEFGTYISSKASEREASEVKVHESKVKAH